MKTHTVELSRRAAPAWAERVARWEQLDAASYAVVDAFATWQEPMPDVFLIASRVGSNAADDAFVASGAISPTRFVATLPSVAISPLLQLTGWVGPMYCLLAGDDTLAAAAAEARLLLDAGNSCVGILEYDVTPATATVCYRVIRA